MEGELGFQDDKSRPLPVTKPRRPHSGLLTSNLYLLAHRNNKGGRKVNITIQLHDIMMHPSNMFATLDYDNDIQNPKGDVLQRVTTDHPDFADTEISHLFPSGVRVMLVIDSDVIGL